MIRYKFQISIGAGNRVDCRPVYGSDLSIDSEIESGQRFMRRKMSGTLQFIREDYDYIMSSAFDDEVFVYLMQWDGSQFVDFWQGSFMRTDCKINLSDHIISVTPNVVDDYTDVLAGLDKEYNILTLPLSIERIVYQKRPLIQVYIADDNRISNFIGGMSWETDVTQPIGERSQLVNNYKFYPAKVALIVNVSDSPIDGVNGVYRGSYSEYGPNEYNALLSNGNGINASYYSTSTIWSFFIFKNDGTVLYDNSSSAQHMTPLPLTGDFSLYRYGTELSDGTKASPLNYPIYTRYLLDVDYIGNVATYPLPVNDIASDHRNYHRCIGYSFDVISISSRFSDTPTQYGMTDDGRYYLPPASLANTKFYPIAQSRWNNNQSFWFSYSLLDGVVESQSRKDMILNDGYELSSVIKSLLSQFSTIQHNQFDSEFLYGTNPLINNSFRIFLTQKTNILAGEYTNPATVCKTTLGQILSFLRNCFNLYWHIENGRLKIEHVKYYANGGTYISTPIVGVDLTMLQNPRNGKPWATGQAEIEYNKTDMPARYQYSFMDESTEVFDGYPIEIKSRYVQSNNVENINIGNVTTNIDYMLLNPKGCSNDGLCAMACATLNMLPNPAVLSDNVAYIRNARTQSEPAADVIYYASSGTEFMFQWLDYEGNVLDHSGYLIGGNRNSRWNTYIPPNAVSIRAVFRSGSSINILRINSSGYEVIFTNNYIDNVEYRLQNGVLAMINLQPWFLSYDMPASSLTINNQPFIARSIRRNKKSTATFPAVGNINANQLVKTLVGEGQIQKISLNLSQNSATAELVYDTE